mgnify:CR=1 FL=1
MSEHTDNWWQIISVKKRGLFDILRNPDSDVKLSTVRLPSLEHFEYSDDRKYETCLFGSEHVSEVVATYKTLEEAVAGHEFYRKKYGLV